MSWCVALLVSSCCDKSGTSCYHLVTWLTTVTDLLQVVPTRPQKTNARLGRKTNVLTSCHKFFVNYLCRDIRLLRICWPHQTCYKMITTCSRFVNNWEQAMQTHPVTFLHVNSKHRMILQKSNNFCDNVSDWYSYSCTWLWDVFGNVHWYRLWWQSDGENSISGTTHCWYSYTTDCVCRFSGT
jgi:hypothetical protein